MDVKQHQVALDQLRDELRAGQMDTFKSYYQEYKPAFLGFSRRYTQDVEYATDAWHDACIAFYENVMENKLTQIESTLKTYLFSIGRNVLINRLRKESKYQHVEEDPQDQAPINLDGFYASDGLAEQARETLDKLGESCRQLLILFYYRKYSINALMHEFKYKNENTVKAHKSRCMKKLRELMGVGAR